MHIYLRAACWAAAILGTAVAGTFGVINSHTTTELLIVLPVAGWMAISGDGRCLSGRSA